MTKTRNLSEPQKNQTFKAFNVVFVVRLAGHKYIEVPAAYCGMNLCSLVMKIIQKGEMISRHFDNHDSIIPKNFFNKKVLFLGLKSAPGKLKTYPEPFSEARFLKTGKKYQVSDIRLRHAFV